MRRRARLPAAVLFSGLVVGGFGCGAPDAPGVASQESLPWFEEISGPLGLDFVHRSGAEGELLFPEIMSGGVALLDADSDGDLDVYFVQGHGAPDELWRNDGDTFERLDDAVSPAQMHVEGYGMGVAAGDVDGDGDVDLFVSNVGRDVLLRNDSGDGVIRFTDSSDAAGLGGDTGWSAGAGFFDADADGDLDLFITRYVHWTPSSDLDCAAPSGGPDYCSPTSYSAPLPDLLYRNEGVDPSGQVRFRDVSAEAGLRKAFGNGLGLAFLDLDRDQDLDVFVANDQSPNQLWRNRGDGTFEDVAHEMGCAVGPNGQARAGMGVATADLDDDGDTDVLVVNLERQADTLLQNEGAFFRDVTAASGLGTLSRRFTRFGVGFVDFDLDGRLDLYLANGRVTLPPGSSPDPGLDPFAEPNLLFRGTEDRRFEPVEPAGGATAPLVAASRAAAFGDLDGDGGVDIVVVNRDGRAHVLRNLRAGAEEGEGHWLLLDLVDESGRATIGAEVSVHWQGRTFHRRVAPSSSYQSSHDPRVHVGLGPSVGDPEDAQVEIRWPDGTIQAVGRIEVDRVHELRRGG